MKKKITAVGVERFLEGDLRLEGPCATYQGRIAFISRIDREPNSLKMRLTPLAERTADGRRWKHTSRKDWEVTLTIESVNEEQNDRVVCETTEHETAVFFSKSHTERLDFESLEDHDIEIHTP